MTLNFPDECERLKRRLAQFMRETDEQAAKTAKAAEQERYRAAYAQRRTPNNPETAA